MGADGVSSYPRRYRRFRVMPGTELALLRREAHNALDVFWQFEETSRRRFLARFNAYKWLAERVGLRGKECHIGQFDEHDCRIAISICKQQGPPPEPVWHCKSPYRRQALPGEPGRDPLLDDDGLRTCEPDYLGEGPTETRKIFRAWAGDGAIEHLFLVASGLDSAQAGEREIYAQVRIAWQTARAAGTCGPQLDFIFNEALKAAQTVHQQASRPANAESLSGFAVRRVNAHLAGDTGRVAIVGISPMTRQCGRVFAAAGLPLHVIPLPWPCSSAGRAGCH